MDDWTISRLMFDVRFSFILQHLSSDKNKELYKKLVVKSMIHVGETMSAMAAFHHSLILLAQSSNDPLSWHVRSSL